MKKKIKKTKKTKLSTQVADHSQADGGSSADEPKKGRPATVNYEEFTRVWRDAASVGDAAKTLGIKRNSASAIAQRLRKEGVVLKSFPRRGSQPIDVKRLNKIAAGKAD